MEIHGLPQPLTGNELVTIHQLQNGNLAKCTMPISMLAAIINSAVWANNLPTVEPTTPGVVWNNGGVVSIS